MKSWNVIVLLVVILVTAAACGGEGDAPVLAQMVTVSPPARTPPPRTFVPLLFRAAKSPIRPGCGDYRLLVTIETDALGVGVRAAGPSNAVDVVWTLSGPGMAFRDPPPAPRVFNEDNRQIFGIEANDAHESVEAHFVLLISGVQSGQQLELEMGHDAPGDEGTWVTMANALAGLDVPGEVLGRFQVTRELRTAGVDLCPATPMPSLEDVPSSLPPRILAFFYPWWGTTAKPEPPDQCSGDSFGWLRQVDGKLTFVTAHTPIAHDGDQVIYQQTVCWMSQTDEEGRTGEIYDVHEVNFLAEQMQMARVYGIDGFAASVHGDNPDEMAFLQETALPVAAQVDFVIAPLYEAPEAGWTYDDDADIEVVGEHLYRLVEMAIDQPAFLTLMDDNVEKAVIFVDPASLARFPSAEAWAAIRQRVDEVGVPYFLWGGPGAFSQVFLTGFDGVFNDLDVIETYEAPLSLEPYALRDERRLAYRATAWAARERGMPYALPVVLGWEGAEALLGPDDVTIPRDYGVPGDYGAYYRTRWADTLENSPDWIVITSWNEWAEGTELEPSDVYPPSRFNYLAATLEYADHWRVERR